MKYRPIADRFWEKVDKGDPDECWEWTACRHRQGYGLLGSAGKTSVRAHRVSWQLAYGAIPDGMLVLHRCDNPPCVNPAHLFLGTQSDNMCDARDKGRASGFTGLERPNAKLTEDDVRVVRQRLANGEEQEPIALSFGVGQSCISRIATGHTWRHVVAGLPS